MTVAEREQVEPGAGRLRRRRRLPRVPRELALLLLVVAVFACAWALLVPAWGGPDEDVHFSYTQTLVERHELPGHGDQSVSTEQKLSMDATNTDPVVIFGFAKPEWSQTLADNWEIAQRSAERDDGGARNTASGYPPAYYLIETIPYRAASSGTLFSRLYAMRLFSGIWLLVSTVAAWLLAGEVFGRRRLLQLVTAAAVGLWPMTSFISTEINPDGMLIALWTLSTWLGVAILRRGLTLGRAAGLCACVGLALVTKATALALPVPAAFALIVGAWRLRGRVAPRTLLRAGAALAVFAIPVVAWAVVAKNTGHTAYFQASEVASTAGTVSSTTAGGGAAAAPAGGGGIRLNELASYLWQFYLPKLPFQQDLHFLFPVFSHYPVFQTWLGGGWANFAWASLWFPGWVYYVFLAVVVAATVAALTVWTRTLRAARAAGRRRLAALRPHLATGVFFGLTLGTLLAGLHWTDFHMYLKHNPAFLQGRYLLPVGALFALVLAQAVRAAPMRLRGGAGGAVLGGLIVFQIACLGLIAARYYA
jgi:4-amino-4-deoxy-L-arabinose transferase-like glycosyltransferase